MSIKVFFIEPTGNVRRSLRRYEKYQWSEGKAGTCPEGEGYYHDAQVFLDVVPQEYDSERHLVKNASGDVWSHDDPRWPIACDFCGYLFKPEDTWQLFVESEYRRLDTGETTTIRDAPVGAMWYAPWMVSYAVGWDGNSLCVKTPGGDWLTDSRASNCTRPDDKTHRCWVRHGDPRTGNIHIDKAGNTCSAGAGSVSAGNWHGFLHNGWLVGS